MGGFRILGRAQIPPLDKKTALRSFRGVQKSQKKEWILNPFSPVLEGDAAEEGIGVEKRNNNYAHKKSLNIISLEFGINIAP